MEFRTILVIVIGVVILGSLALWLGRGMRIRRGADGGLEFDTEAKVPDDTDESTIDVGSNLEIEDAKVGDISGHKGASADFDANGKQNINVMKGGKIKGGEVGDITGIKQEKKDKDS